MVLNNTDLYICEVLNNEYGIKSNEKILYKIDDVIIYEDKEYLDAVKFQIMFPPVSHLCFHFFKQVLRV